MTKTSRVAPYLQASLTYLYRPLSSWWSVGLLLVVFFLCGIALVPRLGTSGLFYIGTAMLAIGLARHVKEQLADSRAHLMPQFRAAHIALAAVAILLAAVVLPSVFAYAHHLSVLGCVAAVFLVFATSWWMAIMPSPAIGLLLFFEWIELHVNPGNIPTLSSWIFLLLSHLSLEPLLWGESIIAAWLLLLVSAGGIVFGLFRLTNIKDDSRLYRIRLYSDGWEMGDEPPAQWQRVKQWGHLDVRTWKFTKAVPQDATDSIPQTGFRRWRYCFEPDRQSFRRIAVLLGLFFTPFVLLGGESRAIGPPYSPFDANFFSLTLTAFFPALFTASLWRQILRTLPLEILKPASRKRFICQLGFAAATAHFKLWCYCTGAAVTAIILGAAWDVRMGYFFFLPPYLPTILLLSLAAQFPLFGANIWLFRHRVWALNFLFIVILAAVVPHFFISLRWSNWLIYVSGPWPVQSWTLILVLLGAVITYDAYRRWLKTELG